MEPNFADDLLAAIAEKGSPVCVGIDPVWDRLPDKLKHEHDDEVDRLADIEAFCREVLQVVAPIAAAVKVQSAYFERYGPAGVDLYARMVDFAVDQDLLVIGDVKRNDIGTTAQAYAEGHLRGLQTAIGPSRGVPDAVTVNGYFGVEGIAPFVDLASGEDRGVFVLVRTSNPSAAEVQEFADASGRKLYEVVAAMVARIGDAEGLVGQGGYSCVGAVVGATVPDQARRLRQIMPRQIFLLPGYGAQGATAADCAAAFKPDGTGAIVNASRSVLFAYRDDRYKHLDWKLAVETAAKAFAQDIRNAVGRSA